MGGTTEIPPQYSLVRLRDYSSFGTTVRRVHNEGESALAVCRITVTVGLRIMSGMLEVGSNVHRRLWRSLGDLAHTSTLVKSMGVDRGHGGDPGRAHCEPGTDDTCLCTTTDCLCSWSKGLAAAWTGPTNCRRVFRGSSCTSFRFQARRLP